MTSNPNQPKTPPKRGLTYRQAGVDIDAGNRLVDSIKPLAAATKRVGVMADIGGFGGLFDLKATGFKDPVLVAANDGVGTKLKLAIETGIHHTIGIDLVAMCVNDLIVQGAEPLFFLDYFATGKLESGIAENVIEGIAEGCRQAGCALIGGETAEMPGMYKVGDYDLAGFSVGAVERDAILPRADVAPGDIVIGLPSHGPHSNGYSLIRHVLAVQGLSVSDPLEGMPGDGNLGTLFLTPTKIYVRAVLAAIQKTGAVKALAHITGGGLSENLPRVLPKGHGVNIELEDWAVKLGLSPKTAGSFAWLQRAGGIAESEMLRTFNCGVGMALIVQNTDSEAVLAALRDAGETGCKIGRVTAQSELPLVRYSGRLGFDL